jgi:hypothetical protein
LAATATQLEQEARDLARGREDWTMSLAQLERREQALDQRARKVEEREREIEERRTKLGTERGEFDALVGAMTRWIGSYLGSAAHLLIGAERNDELTSHHGTLPRCAPHDPHVADAQIEQRVDDRHDYKRQQRRG